MLQWSFLIQLQLEEGQGIVGTGVVHEEMDSIRMTKESGKLLRDRTLSKST
jgi:hypothetical protein